MIVACCCAIHAFNKQTFSRSTFRLLKTDLTSLLKSSSKEMVSKNNSSISVSVPDPVKMHKAASKPSNEVPTHESKN